MIYCCVTNYPDTSWLWERTSYLPSLCQWVAGFCRPLVGSRVHLHRQTVWGQAEPGQLDSVGWSLSRTPRSEPPEHGDSGIPHEKMEPQGLVEPTLRSHMTFLLHSTGNGKSQRQPGFWGEEMTLYLLMKGGVKSSSEKNR